MCSLLGERCVSACKIDPVTGVIGRRGGRVLRDYALRPRDFMRAAAPARWPVHNMTRATKPSRTMSRYAAHSASRREQWEDAMHHCPSSPLTNTLNTTPAGMVSEDGNMTARPGTVSDERIEAESP